MAEEEEAAGPGAGLPTEGGPKDEGTLPFSNLVEKAAAASCSSLRSSRVESVEEGEEETEDAQGEGERWSGVVVPVS